MKQIFDKKMDDKIENETHVFNIMKLIEMAKTLGSRITNNIAFNLVILSLLVPYTKFIIDFLKDNKGESTKGLLRMVVYVNVHIRMDK